MRLALFILIAPVLAAFADTASWYGLEVTGKLMANGNPFNPNKLTAASWGFPLGTRVRVTHGTNYVDVTITDRGPAKRLHREIDLSRAAFEKLAPLDKGLISVTVTPL